MKSNRQNVAVEVVILDMASFLIKLNDAGTHPGVLDEEHTRLRSDGEFATLQDQTLCVLLATAQKLSESFDFADEQGLGVGLVIDEVAGFTIERGDGDAVVINGAFLTDGDFDGGQVITPYA